MPNNYGPKIVTNGLVLCLDAGNTKSYPGSGTVWSDLSGNKRDGVLLNGPTFNSGNKGHIIFDGTNDGVDVGATGSFDSIWNSDVWSITIWLKITGTHGFGYGPFVSFINDTNTTSYCYMATRYGGAAEIISLRDKNGGYTDDPVAPTLNQWYHYGFGMSIEAGSRTTRIYRYGNLVASNSSFGNSGAANTLTRLGYGRSTGSPTIYYLKGHIAQVQMYNRKLTDAEFMQNYNATKSRYNL